MVHTSHLSGFWCDLSKTTPQVTSQRLKILYIVDIIYIYSLWSSPSLRGLTQTQFTFGVESRTIPLLSPAAEACNSAARSSTSDSHEALGTGTWLVHRRRRFVDVQKTWPPPRGKGDEDMENQQRHQDTFQKQRDITWFSAGILFHAKLGKTSHLKYHPSKENILVKKKKLAN